MPVIGLTRHASEAEVDAAAEECWRTNWVEALTRNGDVDMQLVKRELYAFAMQQEVVSIVYDDLSGGQISKPNYNDTGQIISVIREAQEESNNEMVIDAMKIALPEGELARDVLRPYIEEVCTGLDIAPKLVFG